MIMQKEFGYTIVYTYTYTYMLLHGAMPCIVIPDTIIILFMA